MENRSTNGEITRCNQSSGLALFKTTAPFPPLRRPAALSRRLPACSKRAHPSPSSFHRMFGPTLCRAPSPHFKGYSREDATSTACISPHTRLCIVLVGLPVSRTAAPASHVEASRTLGSPATKTLRFCFFFRERAVVRKLGDGHVHAPPLIPLA